jgi:hypothetical protein
MARSDESAKRDKTGKRLCLRDVAFLDCFVVPPRNDGGCERLRNVDVINRRMWTICE